MMEIQEYVITIVVTLINMIFLIINMKKGNTTMKTLKQVLTDKLMATPELGLPSGTAETPTVEDTAANIAAASAVVPPENRAKMKWDGNDSYGDANLRYYEGPVVIMSRTDISPEDYGLLDIFELDDGILHCSKDELSSVLARSGYTIFDFVVDELYCWIKGAKYIAYYPHYDELHFCIMD